MLLWKKQPGESKKAFDAFRIYRDMGPTRSLVRVGQQSGKNRTLIERWSSRGDWQDRVDEFEAHDERVRLDNQLRAKKDMDERHAQIATSLQNKALRRLQNMDPSELSPGGLLSYLTEATRLERLARGEPESIEERREKIEATHDVEVSFEEYIPAFQTLIDTGIIQPSSYATRWKRSPASGSSSKASISKKARPSRNNVSAISGFQPS